MQMEESTKYYLEFAKNLNQDNRNVFKVLLSNDELKTTINDIFIAALKNNSLVTWNALIHELRIKKPLLMTEYHNIIVMNLELQYFKEFEEQIIKFRNEAFTLPNFKDDEDMFTEILAKFILNNLTIKTIRRDDKEEVYIYRQGIYVKEGKTYIKALLRALLDLRFTDNICKKVIDKVLIHTYINLEDFFEPQYEYHIPVLNGLLNLKTFELEPFTPMMYFRSKMTIEYDKTMTCELWEKHLKTVLKDETDILNLQEYFGFCLLGSYRYEKCLMLIGHGKNGKSLTVNVLRKMLGDKNTHGLSLKDITEDMYSASELLDKFVNIGADIGEASLTDTQIFKTLTSGKDLVACARKNLGRVSFYNRAKLIFCCNNLPRTNDKSIGFFRRWIIIDFPYTFVSQHDYDSYNDKTNLKLEDSHIEDKLLSYENLQGVLNWSLIGLKRLLDNNGNFTNSRTTKDIELQWISKTESVQAFLNEKFEITGEEEHTITKQDFKLKYVDFCKEKGIKNIPRNLDKIIKDTMAQNGISEDYSTKKEVIQGQTDLSNTATKRVWKWQNLKLKGGLQ